MSKVRKHTYRGRSSVNHLATHILKARALHYVYNNTLDYKQKQRVGQICIMKLLNSAEVQHLQIDKQY